MNLENWKNKREKAIAKLEQSKKKKDDAACKSCAWEIEFWGNIETLEEIRSRNNYPYKWLQNRIISALVSYQKYFNNLSKKDEIYSLIPTRINVLIYEQRRIFENI